MKRTTLILVKKKLTQMFKQILMKKFSLSISFLVISMAFSSCTKEKICPESESVGSMELSENTLGLIPYQNQDTLTFSNEAGEKLKFSVVIDEPYFLEKHTSKYRYLRTIKCPGQDWLEENLIVSLEDTVADLVVQLVYKSVYISESDPGNVDIVQPIIFDGETRIIHTFKFVIDRKEMVLGNIYMSNFFYDTIAIVEHNNIDYYQVFKSPIFHSDFVPITYNHDFGLLSFYDNSETLWELESK